MGYYVRVFCTSPDVPPLRDVFVWCAEQGQSLTLGDGSADTDLDARDWKDIEWLYAGGMQPILTDVTRSTDDKSLLREEIDEFKEFLEDVDNGPGKRKVLKHLRATKYIVANQFLSDIDDDGAAASAAFLNYFVRNHGGMMQADGEGFYDGDTLIVELE